MSDKNYNLIAVIFINIVALSLSILVVNKMLPLGSIWECIKAVFLFTISYTFMLWLGFLLFFGIEN